MKLKNMPTTSVGMAPVISNVLEYEDKRSMKRAKLKRLSIPVSLVLVLLVAHANSIAVSGLRVE